jgi:dedicator of cytokinesis protein 3
MLCSSDPISHFTRRSILDTYAEFQIPANLRAIERTRSPATTPSPYPISFPLSYPFTLVANGTTTSKTIVNGVLHEIPDLFNCGSGETAVVLLVMILVSTPKDLHNFFDLTLDIEGPANLTRMLTSLLTAATSILNNDAFPSKWLNVNVLAHVVLLKLAEPIATVMIHNYIPPPDNSDTFDTNLWFEYLHMLLKLLSSEQLIIEEFSPQVCPPLPPNISHH